MKQRRGYRLTVHSERNNNRSNIKRVNIIFLVCITLLAAVLLDAVLKRFFDKVRVVGAAEIAHLLFELFVIFLLLRVHCFPLLSSKFL